MRGQSSEQMVFIIVFFLVIGIYGLWKLTEYIGVMAYSTCWREAMEPFQEFDLNKIKTIEFTADPTCLEQMVITKSYTACFSFCRKYCDEDSDGDDCRDMCSNDCLKLKEPGGKTAFVLVQKMRGVLEAIKQTATSPLDSAKKWRYDKNMVYVMDCEMEGIQTWSLPKEPGEKFKDKKCYVINIDRTSLPVCTITYKDAVCG